jgi:anti-anti-sigma factor
MNISVKKRKGSHRVEIDGEMNIYSAVTLKEELACTVEEANEIDLALGKVTEIDTSGVQILIALKREADAAGKALRITSVSQQVTSVIRLLNLEDRFGESLKNQRRRKI